MLQHGQSHLQNYYNKYHSLVINFLLSLLLNSGLFHFWHIFVSQSEGFLPTYDHAGQTDGYRVLFRDFLLFAGGDIAYSPYGRHHTVNIITNRYFKFSRRYLTHHIFATG